MIDRLTEMSKTEKLSDLFRAVIEDTGYMAMLEAMGITEIDRVQNVKELVSNVVTYEEANPETASLSGFLEEVALISDVDNYDADADAVVLMTIHSAKGLEFPVVFLPGMEENLFPSPRSDSDGELSEERRLAYVAVTRAKEAIYITHTSERMLYGRTGSNRISRFVLEIPQDLIKKEGAARTFAPPSGGYTPRYGQSASQPARSYPSYQESRPSRPSFDSSSAWRSDTATAAKKSPASYGVSKFAVGTRVKHPVFGNGTILDARDMGGDVLYQVAFDNGDTKKLMASFAKLQKL
jgi:DNA helicase-2/ATP-dependent DNA helicase PcrA